MVYLYKSVVRRQRGVISTQDFTMLESTGHQIVWLITQNLYDTVADLEHYTAASVLSIPLRIVRVA